MANTGNISGMSDKKSTNTSGRESPIIQQVRIRAYELYEARGRSDGHDLDDWLAAEQQLATGMARSMAA